MNHKSKKSISTNSLIDNNANKKHSTLTLSQRLHSNESQKLITTILFLLLPVTLLILFTVIPAINMGIFSFQERDRFGMDIKWVGFKNYVEIFTRKDLWTPLINSLYYFAGSFIQLGFALFIATILCGKLKFKNFFKGVIFFPYMMNGVAVSIIFRRFFFASDGIINKSQGTLNSILEMFGADPQIWLSGSSALANICLVFVSIWRYIGFDIIMFIGAIQSISPDTLEAAEIDGANGWKKFWHIIFPGIRAIIGLQLIMAVKGAVSVYEIPFIITNGGNNTITYVMKTMDTAFKLNKFGLAAAMGVVLVFIIIIVTIIQKIFFKEEK